MSEQRFTLTPGQVTPLTGALAAGSTIINTDTTHAVWISGSPNVTPGDGVRLGPKGSTSWTTDGAPVYACPDTGVTARVAVTVSTDMAPPVNPVDVGVAVATQLLAQGVPSVLVGEEIPWVSNTAQIDVTRFASLTVRVFKPTAGKVFYEFYSGDIFGSSVPLGTRSFVMAEAGYVSFTVDVAGPFVVIGGSDITSVRVYGTNRHLGNRVLDTDIGTSVAPSQAWTAGNVTDLDMPIMTDGGLHRIRLTVTGSGKGYLHATAWNEAAQAVQQFVILDTGAGYVSPGGATITVVTDDIILPAGLLRFYFQPTVTGTYQVVVSVIPAP